MQIEWALHMCSDELCSTLFSLMLVNKKYWKNIVCKIL